MPSARPRSVISIAPIALVLLFAIAFVGCRGRKTLPPPDLEETNGTPARQAKERELGLPRVPTNEVRFPRRLLFIQISHYSTLNPLLSSEPGKPDQSRPAAMELARGLKIPTQKDKQVFLVSDTAPPPDNNIPTREVVVGAYERFFDTSSPQDRILVYFGGHAIEVDGKVYLAPIEGNRNDPKTLMPLQDFYAKLKACKATQKVVVWDVCRFNPAPGKARPESESMTPSLLKTLTSAPEGVEVVIACNAGEHALEFTDFQIETYSSRYTGTAFLEATHFVLEKNRMIGVVQVPGDPIPVVEWVAAIGNRVTEVSHDVGMKQTVRYFASKPGKNESVNNSAQTPIPAKKPISEIQSIVDEFRIPPMKNNRPGIALLEYPFREEVIAAYKSDVPIEEIKKNKQKYEFQIATLNAYQTLRDVWTVKAKGAGLQQRESIGPITNDLKNAIKKELDAWGIGIAKLEEVNRSLERVSAKKKTQPRRWQAHFDFAHAVVKYRLAFMNEYDKVMGDVLTETLPPLDKTLNQKSYKLVSTEKLKSKKDIQKLAEEANEAFDALIAEYKDSPWAMQAKYEKTEPLGLMWQPSK